MSAAFSGVASVSQELVTREESVMSDGIEVSCGVAPSTLDSAVTVVYALISAVPFSGVLWAYSNRSTLATALPFVVWALAFVVVPLGRLVRKKLSP